MEIDIDNEKLAEFSQEFNKACELRAEQKELDYIEDTADKVIATELIDAALSLRYAYIVGRAVAEQTRSIPIGPSAFTPSNGSSEN